MTTRPPEATSLSKAANGTVRIGYVLGRLAQGDEIKLLVRRKVLEQALRTLMAGSI